MSTSNFTPLSRKAELTSRSSNEQYRERGRQHAFPVYVITPPYLQSLYVNPRTTVNIPSSRAYQDAIPQDTVRRMNRNLHDIRRNRHIGEECARTSWSVSPSYESFDQPLESQRNMRRAEDEHCARDGKDDARNVPPASFVFDDE